MHIIGHDAAANLACRLGKDLGSQLNKNVKSLLLVNLVIAEKMQLAHNILSSSNFLLWQWCAIKSKDETRLGIDSDRPEKKLDKDWIFYLWSK